MVLPAFPALSLASRMLLVKNAVCRKGRERRSHAPHPVADGKSDEVRRRLFPLCHAYLFAFRAGDSGIDPVRVNYPFQTFGRQIWIFVLSWLGLGPGFRAIWGISVLYGTLVSRWLHCRWRCRWRLAWQFSSPRCPEFPAGFTSFTVELLAAIPSVIYGLWAILCLPRCYAIGSQPA